MPVKCKDDQEVKTNYFTPNDPHHGIYSYILHSSGKKYLNTQPGRRTPKSSIIFLAYLLTFFLTLFLAFYLAYLLTFFLALYLAYILIFFLAYLVAFRTFFLAYLMTFFLAFYLA